MVSRLFNPNVCFIDSIKDARIAVINHLFELSVMQKLMYSLTGHNRCPI